MDYENIMMVMVVMFINITYSVGWGTTYYDGDGGNIYQYNIL